MKKYNVTENDKKTIVDLYVNGMKPKEIAKTVRRNKSTVYIVLRCSNVKLHSTERFEKVMALHEKGIKITEIVNTLGIPYGTVYCMIRGRMKNGSQVS